MRNRLSALALAGALVIGWGSAASAGEAPSGAGGPRTLNVTAIVLDQQCMGGDFVQVTLSATGSSSSPVRFAWDFENNGSIDTGPLMRPRIQHTYLDEINVTARIVARNMEGDQASDTVTFSTLNCP